MTKYIRPRRQSKALAFLFGFLTGFVSFVLIIAIVGYFAFYGLTIQSVENFTNSTIIEDDSGLSFTKNLTLNDIVTSISKNVKSGNDITINSLEEALGQDIDIDFQKLVPENVSIETINGYIKDYAGYDTIKDVPFQKLGTVITNLVTKFTFGDAFEVVDMVAKLNLDEYYEQFGLGNFDSLIEYITQQTDNELTSLKDVQISSILNVLSDVIQLARVVDIVNVADGYLENSNKTTYGILSDLLKKINLDYNDEEVGEILGSITEVFGENSSVLTMITNFSKLFTEDIATVMNIEQKTAMQYLPFTKQGTLANLSDVLNKYFKNLNLSNLRLTDTVSFSGNLNYDETTTLGDVAKSELGENYIGEVISSTVGLFSINSIKDIKLNSLIEENVVAFDNIKLQDFIDAGLVKDNEITSVYANKTLSEIKNIEEAKNVLLSDIFTFRTGIIYNPTIYTASVKDFLSGKYLNIRLADLSQLGISLDAEEGDSDASVITKLPKDSTLQDVINLNLNKVFENMTFEDLLTSSGNSYSGFVTAMYGVKITDLLNKNLLDCFENTGVTIGDLFALDSSDSGILATLKDIEIYNIKNDINEILVGDVIGLKSNPDYDAEDPNSKKYIRTNNASTSTIMIGFANYKVVELGDIFSGDMLVGTLLGFDKDVNGDFITDNKILAVISKFSIDDLISADTTKGIYTLKIGDLLGLETEIVDNEEVFVSDNKTLLAIADITIQQLTDTHSNAFADLKIGALLGLEVVDGKYVSDNKALLSIADFTISDLDEEDAFDDIEIGALLGLDKDNNGNYISDNKSLLAISDLTISDLGSADAFDSIEIGALLGLNKDNNGKYLSDNKSLLAISDLTIGDLSSATAFNNIKIGALLGLETDVNGEYVKEGVDSVMLAIANKTVSDLKDTQNGISTIKIGDLLGLEKDVNDNFVSDDKLLLAVADLTIGQLTDDEDGISKLKIGTLLGLEKDNDGKFISDDSLILAIADLTVSELMDTNKGISTIKIGALLGLEKDNNGNFISDDSLILAIADFTVSDLTDGENGISTLKIGTLLGLEKDNNGNYISDDSLILAIANLTINDLTDTNKGISTIKIGDFLGLEKDNDGNYVSDNKTLLAIADFTIDELQEDSTIRGIKIGDILGLEKDTNGDYTGADSALLAIADYTIGQISEDEVISTIEIGKLLGYEYDEVNEEYIIVDNDILKAISKFTISSISGSEGITSLKLGELFGLEKDINGKYVSDNKILEAIADFTINEFNDGLDTLLVGDVFGLNINTSYDSTDPTSKKYVESNNTTVSPILIKLANMKINNLQADIDDLINDMKIGEVLNIEKDNLGNYVGNAGTSKVILAIADFKLSELSTELNDIQIGKLLGYTYDSVNDEYTDITDSVINAIAKFTISDLTSGNAIETLEIGTLLGLEKDNNGNYVTDNKVLYAVAGFTMSDFNSTTGGLNTLLVGDILGLEINPDYENDNTLDKFVIDNNGSYSPIMIKLANIRVNALDSELDNMVDDMEVGELLQLSKDSNGDYIDDGSVSKIILAISKFKLGTIESDMNNITIGELLGLDSSETDTVLKAISGFTLPELTGTNALQSLKIGTLLGLPVVDGHFTSTNKILLAISDYSIAEIGQPSTLSGMKVGKLLGLTDDGHGNYTSTDLTLQAISGFTLDQLTDGTSLKNIEVGALLGLAKVDGQFVTTNPQLKAISRFTIAQLTGANGISTIEIGELMGLSKVDGKYQSSNQILLAVSSFTLGNFNSKLSTMFVGDILGLDVNPAYETDNTVDKFISTSTLNATSTPILIKIANLRVNNINSDLDNMINNMEVGEVLNIPKVAGVYQNDGSISKTVMAISTYKIGELASQMDTMYIGDLLGLEKHIDPDTDEVSFGDSSTFEALKQISKIRIGQLNETTIKNAIKDVPVGDFLGLKTPGGDFGSVSPVLKFIYDTKIGELSDKLATIKLGDALGLEYNSTTSNYDFDTDTSMIVRSLANTRIDDLETAISNLKLSDVCIIGSDSVLSLVDPDTKISELDTAQIDITDLTVNDLIRYGMIEDDPNYSNTFKEQSINDIFNYAKNAW